MKAVVHLGDQKTGSTSVQRMLADQKSNLTELGICQMRFTKVGNYDQGLAGFAGVPVSREVHARTHDIEQLDSYQSIFEQMFADELSELRGNKVVFSFEGLINLSADEVAEVASFLKRYFETVQLVVFLRRQDKRVISGYTTRLMDQGATDKNILFNDKGQPRGPNYEKWLGNWLNHFSAEQLDIVIYDNITDSSTAFFNILGTEDEMIIDTPQKNRSASAFGQELLRSFNETMAGNDTYRGIAIRKIRRMIRNHFLGEPIRPSQHHVLEHISYFRDSNRRLAERLGLEDGILFDEDVSDYPEKFEPIVFTKAQTMKHIDSLIDR